MQPIIKYVVVIQADGQEFAIAVQRFVDMDYQPWGPPVLSEGYHAQAMILRAKPVVAQVEQLELEEKPWLRRKRRAVEDEV